MFKNVGIWVAELQKDLEVITAAEAKTLVDAGQGTLIDVREPGELSTAAQGSIHVPRGLIEFQLPNIVTDADTPLLLHCAAGGRATFAATQLKALGYTNVKVVTCPADIIVQSFGAK